MNTARIAATVARHRIPSRTRVWPVGITILELEFLLARRAAGLELGSVCQLGRQDLFVRPRRLRSLFERHGRPLTAAEAGRLCASGYADELLHELGATEVVAIDASDFEGAAIVADLNEPIPGELHERFDTVIDGGTLEHVFNFPIALANAIQLVKPGGHYLAMTPSGGELGHGLYQFSPELLYRCLSPEHGYEVEAMWLGERMTTPGRTRWWEVADPARIGKRGNFRGRGAQYSYVQARRTGPFPGWAPPQQSDYSTAWDDGKIYSRGRFRIRERLQMAGLTGPLTVDRDAFRRIRP
jgi:SAM-dependent methyltransferase